MGPSRLLRRKRKRSRASAAFSKVSQEPDGIDVAAARDVTCVPRVNNIYPDIGPFKRSCNTFKRSLVKFSRNNSAALRRERLPIILQSSLFRLASRLIGQILRERSQVSEFRF